MYSAARRRASEADQAVDLVASSPATGPVNSGTVTHSLARLAESEPDPRTARITRAVRDNNLHRVSYQS